MRDAIDLPCCELSSHLAGMVLNGCVKLRILPMIKIIPLADIKHNLEINIVCAINIQDTN